MKGKFLTTVILASLLVGGNAMASIARMAVLGAAPTFTTGGTGAAQITTNVANGSLWFDDEYNVFYNPSYINDNKNYLTIDKGAEGGFFKSEFENFAYGVYFNRGGGTPESASQAGTIAPGMSGRAVYTGQTAFNTQRPIDLFIGGDTGVKWGAHLAWAYNRDQSVATGTNTGDEITNRYWHADIGAQFMGLEPFAGMTFATKYQANISTITANQSQQALNEWNIGTRYKYEGWTPYVAYHSYREAGTPLSGSLQLQTTVKTLGIGVGHDTKVADGVHVLKSVGFFYNSVTDDNGAAVNAVNVIGNKDFKQYVLPLNVAIEADAASWLTLRAGAAFDFWNEKKFANLTAGPAAAATDRKQSVAGTTTFRIGSTVKLGKLHIDSAFGNGTVATASNLDSANVGFDSQTFALVNASYHW